MTPPQAGKVIHCLGPPGTGVGHYHVLFGTGVRSRRTPLWEGRGKVEGGLGTWVRESLTDTTPRRTYVSSSEISRPSRDLSVQTTLPTRPLPTSDLWPSDHPCTGPETPRGTTEARVADTKSARSGPSQDVGGDRGNSGLPRFVHHDPTPEPVPPSSSRTGRARSLTWSTQFRLTVGGGPGSHLDWESLPSPYPGPGPGQKTFLRGRRCQSVNGKGSTSSTHKHKYQK